LSITIVGGGIVGCAVAYELAARGADVHIIDPRGAGRGATYASAGILAPYIEGHSEPLLRLGVCSLAHYDSFIDRVSTDAGQPIEYRRSGTLQVAHDEGGARELINAAATLASAAVPHSYVDGAAARHLEPALSPDVYAALLIPQHGYVAVATFMSALGKALARRGARFSVARVERIESTGGAIQLMTPEGPIGADAVVIAAGSWSAGVSITAARQTPVRPIRGQLLHLRCPQPPVSRVIFGSSAYLVPWHDGSVLVGATSEDVGFDESATAGGVYGLLEGATGLVPALRSARFDEVRVGLRPFTDDELPLIGASSRVRGVYYATGHYRSGVLMAPLTAVLVAELLEGRERPELALTRPNRFGL
jgi:glycine oxidase